MGVLPRGVLFGVLVTLHFVVDLLGCRMLACWLVHIAAFRMKVWAGELYQARATLAKGCFCM